MKTLKVNFTVVCMLLMTAVSVCLTSCGKEDVVTPDQEIAQERNIDDIISDFESDPILEEVKVLTAQIQGITKSEITNSGLSVESIADYYDNNDYEKIQEVFSNIELSSLTLRHNELSYELQQKYPELYEGVEVNTDVRRSLNKMMEGSIVDRGCNWRYWVCATAAAAPFITCIAASLPGIYLPSFCVLSYGAALGVCAAVYC